MVRRGALLCRRLWPSAVKRNPGTRLEAAIDLAFHRNLFDEIDGGRPPCQTSAALSDRICERVRETEIGDKCQMADVCDDSPRTDLILLEYADALAACF